MLHGSILLLFENLRANHKLEIVACVIWQARLPGALVEITLQEHSGQWALHRRQKHKDVIRDVVLVELEGEAGVDEVFPLLAYDPLQSTTWRN